MITVMIKSAIVLAVAACIAGLLRRQSAALRHAIWTAGLLGALLVPLCSVTLPAWQNGFVGWAEHFFRAPSLSETSSGPTAASPLQPTVPDLPPGENGHSSAIAAPAPAGDWSILKITTALWIVGAALGMLLMLLGAVRLAWVAIRSEPVTDPRWLRLAEEVRRALGFRRPVRLLQSPSGHFLGTWGILVPRVLLPSSAGEWTDDRAWMVLGHELAHIKRHDWVVQVLAEAARAIYWFNPVFWMAYSWLRRESEQACDDTVIRLGAGGPQYAEELLELARSLRSENRMRSPILAMAQPSHLERRLVAVLDPALNRLAATPWSVIVVALAAVGLTLPLAAVRAPEKVITRVVAPAIDLPAKAAPVPNPEAKAEIASRELPALELPADIGNAIHVPADLQPGAAAQKSPPALLTKLDAPSVPLPIECKVTPSMQEIKMKAAKSPLGPGPWQINEDRTIWAWDQPYVAGTAVNTMWMKPENADLSISGRRLDGDSSPLQVRMAKDSTAGYIATSLMFPNAGCWEVTATAGSSTLTYITRVDAQ
jgi:beta-lactamase regulating signal transducer with metallopeptidase domain